MAEETPEIRLWKGIIVEASEILWYTIGNQNTGEEKNSMKAFALKGNICYCEEKDKFNITEHGYVVCEGGFCAGVFQELPQKYAQIPCRDYGDSLILPGLTDLHMHAPQYAFRGIGMDLELLEWLNTHAFKAEQKYADPDYARKAYQIFVDDLVNSATTRICLFGTLHAESTLILMELLEQAGIHAYVGKVNMDRNCPDYLCEESAEKSAEDTRWWIEESLKHFRNVRPILTPRFIPSCSDEVMEELGILQRQYSLPAQSHLSENLSEIQWVSELCPGTAFYGEAYEQHGLFGKNCKTIMAHCVHSGQEEMERMRTNGVFVAHCPQSNANLSSGIAPVRAYLDRGIRTGLGSDIAGGTGLSMFRAMSEAIQCSKLRWRLVDQSLPPLKTEEAYYLATKGGGEFFGMVGSFETGYEFDAVVIDDSTIRHPYRPEVSERLERLLYLAEEKHTAAKYIAGRKIFDRYEEKN